MNNAVEAGGSTRPIALGLCLTAVLLTGFAIRADTLGSSEFPAPHSVVISRPLVRSHVTRSHVEVATEQLSAKQPIVSAETERPQALSPTRSSFMATWQRVPGAIGYRLDVATDRAFTRYVEGYRDLDVGNITGRSVTGLSGGTTYYYRVRAYDGTSTSAASEVTAASTAASAGLVILASFDRSITANPNAAAIEAMIHRCVAIYESLFSDQITIHILFRYATTEPDGTRMATDELASSLFVVYSIPWNVYLQALRDQVRQTNNDASAYATLPSSAPSGNIIVASANGRTLENQLDTPPAMDANGSVDPGGPYDGIVTLNSAQRYKFSRPPTAGLFDAQTGIEHEVNEVMGLGSWLGQSGHDLRPQDLFSWSSPGVRNVSPRGTRYFSINSGSTTIVNFNETPGGDFGDWASPPCPQPNPYVQNAFGCPGQSADVTATSPEGINLDILGYDLVGGVSTPTDFNNDAKPDFVLYNPSTRQTAFWFLNDIFLLSGYAGPTLPGGWRIAGVADFNRDGHPDFALFNPNTGQTVIWYFSGPRLLSGAAGPTLPAGWQLVATADFNSDGKPDYVLYNPGTLQTVLWLMNNNVHTGSAVGPTLPAGWNIVGAADFNRDGKTDYLLFNPATGGSMIIYLSGATFLTSRFGMTSDGGFELGGTSDFNGDYKPDYLLFNPSTGETIINLLEDNQFSGQGDFGPTIPAGWTLVAP